ncbi:MAG TPA: hypothetical protein VI792_00345 [Candidatus Eisenbacteria bacterium]
MPARPLALDTLAASPVLWRTAVVAPRLFPGHLLHQAALRAAWEGSFRNAERLFEAAARCYRAELELTPLARLRAHQAMARARATTPGRRESEGFLEVERRLSRLESIEAPWPPFPLVGAASLLATWMADLPESSPGPAPREGETSPEHAA